MANLLTNLGIHDKLTTRQGFAEALAQVIDQIRDEHDHTDTVFQQTRKINSAIRERFGILPPLRFKIHEALGLKNLILHTSVSLPAEFALRSAAGQDIMVIKARCPGWENTLETSDDELTLMDDIGIREVAIHTANFLDDVLSYFRDEPTLSGIASSTHQNLDLWRQNLEPLKNGKIAIMPIAHSAGAGLNLASMANKESTIDVPVLHSLADELKLDREAALSALNAEINHNGLIMLDMNGIDNPDGPDRTAHIQVGSLLPVSAVVAIDGPYLYLTHNQAVVAGELSASMSEALIRQPLTRVCDLPILAPLNITVEQVLTENDGCIDIEDDGIDHGNVHLAIAESLEEQGLPVANLGQFLSINELHAGEHSESTSLRYHQPNAYYLDITADEARSILGMGEDITRDLPRLIREQANDWITKGEAPNHFQINNGMCEDFAMEIIGKLGGESEDIQLTWADDYTVNGEGDYWDEKLLSDQHPLSKLTHGVSWRDFRSHVPAHAWISVRTPQGWRHYDAECPQGTLNLFTLPLIRRGIENIAAGE